MATNQTQTLWVSNSSIGDYLSCPRLYYLRNIYRDPQTYHKLALMNPSLALGQIVHSTLGEISLLSSELRLQESLLDRYERLWKGVAGLKGGFEDIDQEQEFKERGALMLQRIMNNPGPILNKAIKVSSLTKAIVISDDLPNYWFSEKELIILCGKIDWIEYLQEDDGIHIIDFKTGKNDEKEGSLQLPIYLLLSTNCQKRKVKRASYWYLDRDNNPQEMLLPNLEDAYARILQIALIIKEARTAKSLKCKKGGCYACEPFERILEGEGKFIGIANEYQDVYIL